MQMIYFLQSGFRSLMMSESCKSFELTSSLQLTLVLLNHYIDLTYS